MGHAYAISAGSLLNEEIPYPDEFEASVGLTWFVCAQHGQNVSIWDAYLSRHTIIAEELLHNTNLDLANWYARSVRKAYPEASFTLNDLDGELTELFTLVEEEICLIELLAANVHREQKPEHIAAVQRNAASPKDFRRLIPEPVVVVVDIDGHPARALLDSGSLADFMSSRLAHQLNVKSFELEKPFPVHLAVQGSRAKINMGCKAEIRYQLVREQQYFDIVNLLNYDLILGTPFWFQHNLVVGLNPTTVIVGSPNALPMEGPRLRVLESKAAEVFEEDLEAARVKLMAYVEDICVDTSDTPLPPLQAINHTIPLKDEGKLYSWRPAKCPDALRPAWTEKRDAYIKSGHWQMTTARNTSPMLLLTKPGTG
ncbi:hypothetical protein OBBRIDRAFT_742726, partial [Obba rivulosa]